MKKIQLFLTAILSCALLFSGCDEEEDNKLFPLLLAGAMEKGEMIFNTYTVHNYWPDTTIIDKDVSMTSPNGFVLSGDVYVAQFNYGGELFAISLPSTVTEISMYDSSDYPTGFSPSYTIYIDGWEFSQWIFDGYGDETDFTLQVTSLSGGRITATFSGLLCWGTIETLFVNSSIAGGTLSAAIRE